MLLYVFFETTKVLLKNANHYVFLGNTVKYALDNNFNLETNTQKIDIASR